MVSGLGSKDGAGFSDIVSMPAYRCPTCKIASRDQDKTQKEGQLVIRSITYECGTVLKIIQDSFRFRSKLIESEKCLEMFTPTRLIKQQ